MKTFLVILVIPLALVGCGVTIEQRKQWIDQAVELAGAKAEAETRKQLETALELLEKKLIAAGVNDDALTKALQEFKIEAEKKIAEARALAEAKAKEEAGRHLPPADPEGGSWFGKLLATLLPAVLPLILGAAGAKGDPT